MSPWSLLGLVREMRWTDAVDIAIVSLLIWTVIRSLRSTRARVAGGTFLSLFVLFLLAKQLELGLTIWLLQGLAALFVLVIVVVFQDEIRQLMSKPPSLWIRRGDASDISELLADVIGELATGRTGALLVLPGRDLLGPLVTGGVELGGLASKPLLLSLFDESSPGHDGAVILDRGRVTWFGAHLPLSDDAEQLRERGTRHAAALGLAERSDALVVVVSEETGRVSTAQHGTLTRLHDVGECRRILGEHLSRHEAPRTVPRPSARAILARAGVEGPLAGVISASLWLALVPGAIVDRATYTLPVVVQNIPSGFELETVTPSTVAVTVTGPRRELFLLDTDRLGIRVDATLARFGRQQFGLSANQLLLPPPLAVVRLTPAQVTVTLKTGKPTDPELRTP